MASKEKQKRIVSNTVYTIGGALLMNGVLQIVVYPLLNRKMGSDQLGEHLYLMGLVAILCPSVGQALNTSRLVVRRDYQVKNGDYNVLLLLFGGVGTAITLFVARDSMVSLPVIFWTAALLMTTIFRYYGDVEYRLNLNYKKVFLLLLCADRRIYSRLWTLFPYKKLVSGISCRRGCSSGVSCRNRNSVQRIF